MSTFKILHTADIHFDTPFMSLPSKQAYLRKDEVFQTFSNLLDLAIKEKVDAILIAGDLFDSQYVKPMTIKFLQDAFCKISDIKVFISPGNHDYINQNSIYNTVDFPSNVYIFKGEIERYCIKEKGVSIYGAGFTSPYVDESMLKGFTVYDENEINIGIFHGTILPKGEYNPISSEDIEKSKLNYLALGHVHEYLNVVSFGKTFCAYSGALEGRGFDETGQKGVIIAEVTKDNTKVRFVPLSKRMYINLPCDISGAKTTEDIVNIILDNMGPDKENHLYKVVLKGEIDKDLIINTDIICERLKDHVFYIKCIDETKIKIDLESLSKEFGLRGAFVRELLKQKDSPLFYDALKIGLLAFDGIVPDEIV